MKAFQSPLVFVQRLFWVYIALFAVSESVKVWFGMPWLEVWFCLPNHMVSIWQAWRFVTYSFFHAGLLHIGFNLWLLYSLARFLLNRTLPLKKFLAVYFLGIILGGAVWFVVHLGRPYSVLLGASSGCLALLAYACLRYPDQTLSVLLFFICPIQLQARWLFMGLLAYEAFSSLVYELPGLTSIAHSAHLGGILAGWLTFRLFRESTPNPARTCARSLTYSVYREYSDEDRSRES